MWERLCETFGLDELRADPRAASNEERVHNRALVEEAVAAVIAPLRAAEVTERLSRAGVLVAPVRDAAAAVEDPQVGVLGLIDEIDDVRFARSPLSQFNPGVLAPAQRLGEDSTAVLAEYLSLGPAEVDDLAAAGIIETADMSPAAVSAAPGAAQAAST